MRHKFDEPPLLAPGRHHLSLDDIDRVCVRAFKTPDHRAGLFQSFCLFVRAFTSLGIPCDMLIDGSFLTEKETPSDVDVAVRLDAEFVETMNAEQRELIDRVNQPEPLYVDGVDGFAWVNYAREHDLFGSDVDERETWAEQYGIEHSKFWLKGMVVLTIGETDVGLRVRGRVR